MKTTTYFEIGENVKFNKSETFKSLIEHCNPYNSAMPTSLNFIKYEDQGDELVGKIYDVNINESIYTIHYHPTNVGGRKIQEYATLRVSFNQVIGLST
jgi:hypothetical protein